jgi:hypothetical protein
MIIGHERSEWELHRPLQHIVSRERSERDPLNRVSFVESVFDFRLVKLMSLTKSEKSKTGFT